MKKRVLALILTIMLITGIAVTASAGFADISDSETAIAAAALESMGIVTGTGANTYSPGKTLTRAEFAALAVRAMGLDDKAGQNATKTLFSDATPDKWYAGYVNLAYEEGIINGYGNGNFGPDDSVTYGQVATILLRILGYTEAEVGKSWPNDYVTYANDLGLAGSLTLSAGADVSRGNAAVLLYNTVRETVNGSALKYYETISGVTSVENVIVLNNNATSGSVSGYLMVCAIGDDDASIKYYQQKNEVSDTLVGYLGKALLNSAGRVVGFLPDGEGYRNVVVSSATASGITTRGGETIRVTGSASVIYGDTVYKYNSTGYLQVDAQSGKSVRLYYDDNGAVSHIYISSGAAFAGTYAAVAETHTAANELARALGITGTSYNIVKNSAAASRSDIARYDVAYYDAATDTMYVSDNKLTGIIISALPSVGAAETITIYGTTLDVLECAWDTLGSFKLGDNVTLLLTDDNKVAAAYAPSTVRAEMIGVLADDGKSVTLCGSGITLTGTISASSSLSGMLVKVTSNAGSIRCSATSSVSPAGSVSVTEMTVGDYKIAPGAEIYEDAVAGAAVCNLSGAKGVPSYDMSEIYWTTSFSAANVAYLHLNPLGQIDILLLRDVTGNSLAYGKITAYGGTSGINLGTAGMEAFNDAVTITNSENLSGSEKYIYPGINIASGYYGIAVGTHSGGNNAVLKATGLGSGTVTASSLRQSDDGWSAMVSGYEIPFSDNVEVLIKSTSAWYSGEEGLLVAVNSGMDLTAYYDRSPTTGAQIRIIIAG